MADLMIEDGKTVPLSDAIRAALVTEPFNPVPASISIAAAFDVMAGFILPDGRALDTALLEDTQAALDATADLPDSDEAKIEAKRTWSWVRRSSVFERTHPRLLAFQSRYGLSDPLVDDMFRAAEALSLT